MKHKVSGVLPLSSLAAARLHREGLAIGALVLCRVLLVCADLDAVERTIVHTVAMMLAGCYTAMDAFVCIFVHFIKPPCFCFEETFLSCANKVLNILFGIDNYYNFF